MCLFALAIRFHPGVTPSKEDSDVILEMDRTERSRPSCPREEREREREREREGGRERERREGEREEGREAER